MSSNNWVVDNLNNALNTWNSKMAEVYQLVTQSPVDFKGGGIWKIITDINGALQAIGLPLLVLFFVVGVVKLRGNQAPGACFQIIHPVHWRTDFQYAGSCRSDQNVRSHCERNDGIVKMNHSVIS